MTDTAAFHPIGTPGVPWGAAEKAAWRARQRKLRSHADEVVSKIDALRDRFDVMLVDIGLPEIDGYEVARRVVAGLGSRRPLLVAMTGYGQPEDRRRALEVGFDLHLVKPICMPTLMSHLARLPVRGAS